MNKAKILKQFEEKFGKRLNMLEVFYQNHGGEPFRGETIPDWLSKVLDGNEINYHKFVKSRDFPKACRVCRYTKKSNIHV